MTDRMPPIPSEKWSEVQKRAVESLTRGPRGGLFGPFVPLLRSPELMDRVQKLGAFIRYECSVPERLRELAILVTARHWKQGFEWSVHAPLALKLGIERSTIDALGRGETPAALADDERAVFEFCVALHREQHVSDVVYEKVRALLGEAGTVELTALCGYYALLAMVMNMARSPVPPGADVPF